MKVYFIRTACTIRFFETPQERAEAAATVGLAIVGMGRADVSFRPITLTTGLPFTIFVSSLKRDSVFDKQVFVDAASNLRYAEAPFDRVSPPIDVLIVDDPDEPPTAGRKLDMDWFIKDLFPMDRED